MLCAEARVHYGERGFKKKKKKKKKKKHKCTVLVLQVFAGTQMLRKLDMPIGVLRYDA